MINSLKLKYKNLPVQVKASIWFLFASFLQKGISAITTPIFTRLLTKEEYGKFSVFNSWMGIITVIVTLNLYYGVYEQGLIKFEEERKFFSSSLKGLETALVATWIIIYSLFQDFFNSLFGLSSIQMYAMLAIIWTTAIYNFWAAEQRVEYKFKKLVVLTMIVTFAQPCLSVILIKASADHVTARILSIAIVNVFAYTGLFFVQFRKGSRFFERGYWLYALKFNIPLIPHYLSQTILINADRIMIEKMDSASNAGIYSLAYSISMVMTLFNTALNQTISPWIFKKIKEKKVSDITKVSYISMIVIGVLNIMLIAFAPEVVRLFAPKSYYEAVYIIPPVALSGLLLFAYDQFGKFAFYYEKTNMIAAATMIAAILNIILNFIAIPVFGYIAAGYTTLISYFLYALSYFIVMNNICNAEHDFKNPYSARALLMGLGLLLALSIVFIFSYRSVICRGGLIIFISIIFVINRKFLLQRIKLIAETRNKE